MGITLKKDSNKMKKISEKVIIDKNNAKEYRGKAGELTISYRNKMLKVFHTSNVYALYHTLKSLQKKDKGSYAKLPKYFQAAFIEQ